MQTGKVSHNFIQINNDKVICRICLEDGLIRAFIKPCECKGSIQYVHEDCLKTWLLRNHKIDEIAANRVTFIYILRFFVNYAKRNFNVKCYFHNNTNFHSC